jgi:ATP-dependent DNA ligase
MLIFGFSCLGWNFCFKRRLYAFDILALDGDDLRNLLLHLRKTNLARLLARR